MAFFRVDPASTEEHLPAGSAVPPTTTPARPARRHGADDAFELGAAGRGGRAVRGRHRRRSWLDVGDPLRTAQAFVPHPFGAPGERLYRTGDPSAAARRRTAGIMSWRIDHQVKIRRLPHRAERDRGAPARTRRRPRGGGGGAGRGEAASTWWADLDSGETQRSSADSPAGLMVEQGAWFERIKQQPRADLRGLHGAAAPAGAGPDAAQRQRQARTARRRRRWTSARCRTRLTRPRATNWRKPRQWIWAEVLKVERVWVFDNFLNSAGIRCWPPRSPRGGAEGPATQRAATGDVRMHHGGRRPATSSPWPRARFSEQKAERLNGPDVEAGNA
ncbi:hypothetical protein ACPA9J_19040 [Pseudomonas aeruginosa]